MSPISVGNPLDSWPGKKFLEALLERESQIEREAMLSSAFADALTPSEPRDHNGSIRSLTGEEAEELFAVFIRSMGACGVLADAVTGTVRFTAHLTTRVHDLPYSGRIGAGLLTAGIGALAECRWHAQALVVNPGLRGYGPLSHHCSPVYTQQVADELKSGLASRLRALTKGAEELVDQGLMPRIRAAGSATDPGSPRELRPASAPPFPLLPSGVGPAPRAGEGT